ncbi:condensation domain-containing protein [Streptomyces sp. NPDC014746]|uniref:condensation domain-containing protein n=1 Tax=Streptomyces sp. NPDC014746 TaxID=3364904 RepID=UPI0036F53A54
MIPSSFAQQRLWFFNQFEGAGATYNLPFAVRLRGVVDHGALRAALVDVVMRHESLRTVFVDVAGVPWQRIMREGEFELPLRVVGVSETELDAELSAAAGQGFDLAADIPVKAWLFELGSRDQVLMLVMHHIAVDGWSLAPLSRDLATAYSARLEGRAPSWEPLPAQYADYALWQRELLGEETQEGSIAHTQLGHWRKALAGAPDELALPLDRPRPAVSSYRGDRVPITLDADLHQALTLLARQTGTSLFMVLQAGLTVLLTRLGAGHDIVIGAPTAGRTDEALHDLVGFFVNTLVLRVDTSGNPTFRTLLDRVRETDLDAFSHQDVPFDRLVEHLNPPRSTARHPLFQVMMVLQESTGGVLHLSGTHTTEQPLDLPIAKFDLNFTFAEVSAPGPAGGGVDGHLEYATDLFDQRTARMLADGLSDILAEAGNHPDRRIGEMASSLGEGSRDPRPAEATATPRAGGRGVTIIGERERVLCGLFAEALGLDEVGPHENFFSLGGHSLLALKLINSVRAAFSVEVPLKALFQAQTAASLMKVIDDSEGTRPPVVRHERTGLIPSSFAQQRLWFFNQFEGAGATYNLPFAVRLRGVVDHGALRAALVDVVMRHESLRTVFVDVAGVPWQRIMREGEFELPLRVVGVSETELDAELSAAAGQGFDLAADIPVKAWLFELGSRDQVLMLVMHHIAVDGWSLAPLSRDLATAYSARLEARPPPCEPHPPPYADHAPGQRQRLGQDPQDGSIAHTQLGHWRKALAGAPDELALPLDRPRPAVSSYRGDRVPITLDADLHQALTLLARQTGTSLFMVLQAGLTVLLTRLGAGHDIVIGAPTAGRTDEALHDLVGFFVNTLVLRVDTSGNPTFRTLLDRVRETDLDAFSHQDVPFDRLVEHLNPPRSTARHPLFQVMMVLQEFGPGLRLSGVDVTEHHLNLPIARFDIWLGLVESRSSEGEHQGIRGELRYKSDLFDESTARGFAKRLAALLREFASDPTLPVTPATPCLGPTRFRRKPIAAPRDPASPIVHHHTTR